MQLHRSLGFLEKSSDGDPQGIWAQLDKSSGRNFCSTLLGLANFEANYLCKLGAGTSRIVGVTNALNKYAQALAGHCPLEILIYSFRFCLYIRQQKNQDQGVGSD
jgi:hypothetical protein